MNIFLRATREKLRFSTAKGLLSVEDLWDLPLKNIRSMANTIHKTLKSSDDLFATRNKEECTAQLKLDILVQVVELREADKQAAVNAQEKESKKALLKDIIAKKKLEATEGQSIEELEKQLAEL